MKKVSLYFGVIFLPIVLTIIMFVSGIRIDMHLGGYSDKVQKPQFSVNSYLTGEFQKECVDYFETNFCPKGFFVKLYSTIQYNCFKLGNRVIGYNNDIFEIEYIYERLGLDAWNFSDNENKKNMELYVKKLEDVQSKLRLINKDFYFYVSSSKADINYDNIPSKYINMKSEPAIRASDYLRTCLKETSLNYSFTNDLGKQQKYPAFYTTGIHWSCTYEQDVSRYLISELEKLTGKDYPDIILSDIQESNKPFNRETDVYDLLNIWNKSNEKYYTYTLEAQENTDSCDKMKILMQGDSFGSGFRGDVLSVYPDEDFFTIDYANYLIDDKGNYDYFDNDWSKLDLISYLDQVDVVIVETTPPNLVGYSYGFIDYLDETLSSYIQEKNIHKTVKDGGK